MHTADFEYELPPGSIAQEAIHPRHDSRVLVASNLSELPFHSIGRLLRPDDLLVVNRTRVRAARLTGTRRPTGGRAELLLTKRLDEDRWQALVRPAKKMPPGTIVDCGPISAEIVTEQHMGVVTVVLAADSDIETALATSGTIPLPPYFHGRLDTPERYQTLFAKKVGSAAAPTAALHFTEELIEDLREQGVNLAEVELEVGLDTFRPMEEGPIDGHVMHRERIVIDQDAKDAIDLTRSVGGRVIAVGTTVVRTLESAAIGDGRIEMTSAETDLFIRPGYAFRVVDGVFTNFHAPGTTLIVMIAAMLGKRWCEVYEHAVRSGFRFLSFGDSMFIEDLRP